MILQNLKPGTELTLEIVWGDLQYHIPSKVLHTTTNGIMIPMFRYHGTPIDFNAQQFQRMHFNIHADNNPQNQRLSWNGVTLEVHHQKGESFYEVRASKSHPFSISGDRRDNNRISVDVQGSLRQEADGEIVTVQIYDISPEGIAFISKADIKPDKFKQMLVTFADVIREHDFEVHINCACVRRVSLGEDFLYGCTVFQPDENTLAYIDLKQKDLNRIHAEKLAGKQ